ncbi:peptidylprolyl isomerase [Membranicola marinus]|uniref:Peptidylprolyl isomerase n=1 Tax=Membranihabitans marinus TaxID=1227546 RepID=A0A953HJQ5_9BACT|nr:peptidylprolyl isomerase [Membranihabitans marinus]MBY5956977.1 peptidylprolyl isomerase [Membranihabitans marinus]
MRIKFIIVLCLFVNLISAQEEGIVLEQLAAKLGGEILLSSEILSNLDYQTAVSGGLTKEDSCSVIQSMFLNKLLVDQAKLDSIVVPDAQVEQELDRKIQYIIQTMNGDIERFENYYGKNVSQVKKMMRKDMKAQAMARQMQSQILSKVKITPKEVIDYYESLPVDSLPYFNSEVEIGELVMFPEVSQEEREKAIALAVQIQNKIEEGENFNTLARKHSDDPGSARIGGDLGWQMRGTFVPEFEAAAFNLDDGEISDIVETDFGFHIIKMIGRRGNRIHVEHILIKPEIKEEDVERAKEKLDSIRTMIIRDSIPWEIAVRRYGSEEVQSFHNGGRVTNPQSGNTFFQTPELETDVYFAIDTIEVGDITAPVEMTDPNNQKGSSFLKLIKLFSRSKPHTANLGEDYDKIKRAAIQQRQEQYLMNWLRDKIRSTYIQINPEFLPDCPTMDPWRAVNVATATP